MNGGTTTCDLARCSPNQPANHLEALLPADRERLLPALGRANEALIAADGAPVRPCDIRNKLLTRA